MTVAINLILITSDHNEKHEKEHVHNRSVRSFIINKFQICHFKNTNILNGLLFKFKITFNYQ